MSTFSLSLSFQKYMIPLKSSEHSDEIEGSQVDQIFCQVPEILKFHETFLETLKSRLTYWDTKQKIGDVFVDVVSLYFLLMCECVCFHFFLTQIFFFKITNYTLLFLSLSQ